jgi:hypothetical protein
MTTLLKITNNNISANPNNLTKISSSQFPVAGINVRGRSGFQNGCQISSNHIFSSGQTYTDGMSFGSQISFSATKNDICGFINNGIVTYNKISNIGVISNNNISRGISQTIKSFISGYFLPTENPSPNLSSALIVDNYFSHDTVDGVSNWQDVVKSRGSGWTVERNKNQTEEVIVDSSVGEKSFSNNPITITRGFSAVCYWKFRNKISSDNGIVKFIVDNSIKREVSAHISLLYSTNELYKWPAWETSSSSPPNNPPSPTYPLGPYYLYTDDTGLIPKIDSFGLPLWFLENGVWSELSYSGIEWIPKVYKDNYTIPHPYYVVKNGTCNLANYDNSQPIKKGEDRLTNLLDTSIYRIYQLIKNKLNADSATYGLPPIRCKIFGSNADNDGIYEIDPAAFNTNIKDGYIQIKRIIGIPYTEEYTKETYNLGGENNYFNWSINSNEILPPNVFIVNTSCDLKISQLFAGDNQTYSLLINSRKIQIKATSEIEEFSNELNLQTVYELVDESLSLDTSSARSPLTKINIKADLPAVADYREVDASNLKIRYKW